MPEISIGNFFTASKAFFIPVSKYDSESINDLDSPLNDVKALQLVLQEFHGFTTVNIHDFLAPLDQKDSNHSSCHPTSGEILDFLSAIKVSEGDRTIIYFACHGIAVDSDGMPEGYLLGADATPGKWETFIKMSDILERINALSCKHLLIILDCCYAGAFRWANKTRGPYSEVPKTVYYERFSQYANNKAWQVLTSSAHDQKAIDTLRLGKREADHNNNISPFAELLIDAFKSGAADLSYGNTAADGVITVTELSYYLRSKIFEQLFNAGISGDKQQLPMLFPLINASKSQFDKGEFVFINPAFNNSYGRVQLKHSTQRNPYKGLESYGSDDNKIFYGRQRVLEGWSNGTSRNIGLIEASMRFNLIILTGPSGIGKSSLAKAGLLSYYKTEKIRHDVRPGKTPMSSNRTILEQLMHSATHDILLIDQYEELVTICMDTEERINFENALFKLIGKHLIVVTIRTDFEVQFIQSPLFSLADERAKKYRFVIPPFLREEIEEIVVQPAVQEVLEFKGLGNDHKASDKFIDRIVDDAFQNPGSLPLLSMSLRELYEKRENQNLLEKVYNDFGGIAGILDRKGIDEFNKLEGDPDSQMLFQQLIYRMISFEGGQRTKRKLFTAFSTVNPISDDELIYDSSEKTTKIIRIAEQLIDARLLNTGIDQNNKPFIEPAHDALLNSWSLLQKWLETKPGIQVSELSKIELHRTLSDASLTYKNASDDPAYLWADPRLELAKDHLKGTLNTIEATFIRNSLYKKTRVKRGKQLLTLFAFLVLALFCGIGWNLKQQSATAAKRGALLLAESSDKYGATEQLAILREAYNVNEDSSISKRLLALLNEYEYYDPFAINRFDSKDSILNIQFVNNSHLLVSKHLTDEEYVVHNDSLAFVTKRNAINNRFHIVSDSKGIHVSDRRTLKTLLIKNLSLDRFIMSSEGSRINLLVHDTNSYHVFLLDTNLNFVLKKALTYYPSAIDSFPGNDYFAIHAFDNDILYDANGQQVDSYPGGMRIIGLHVVNNIAITLLQDIENGKVCLTTPSKKKEKKWIETTGQYTHPRTSVKSYLLSDSVFLLQIGSLRAQGLGEQDAYLIVCNFKEGSSNILLKSSNDFKAFQLSPDKKRAITYTEADSLYSINLQTFTYSNTFHEYLVDCAFAATHNLYYSINKSSGGYITHVYDSSDGLLNEIEYSDKPDYIAISHNNKFISICFNASTILTWRLGNHFDPEPWQDMLSGEDHFTLEVSDISINEEGSFIGLCANVTSYPPVRDSRLGKRYYLDYTLQSESNDNLENYIDYTIIPGDDFFLQQAISNDSIIFTCIDRSTKKSFVVNSDLEKQHILNRLFQQVIPVVVKGGVAYFIESNHSHIAIDSFQEIIQNWGNTYFIVDKALVKQTYFPDSVSILFEKGMVPKKIQKKLNPSIEMVGTEPALLGKDQSLGFSVNDFLASSIYDDGKRAILMTHDGVVHFRKTNKFLHWFLKNGYVIPMKIEIDTISK